MAVLELYDTIRLLGNAISVVLQPSENSIKQDTSTSPIVIDNCFVNCFIIFILNVQLACILSHLSPYYLYDEGYKSGGYYYDARGHYFVTVVVVTATGVVATAVTLVLCVVAMIPRTTPYTAERAAIVTAPSSGGTVPL